MIIDKKQKKKISHVAKKTVNIQMAYSLFMFQNVMLQVEK